MTSDIHLSELLCRLLLLQSDCFLVSFTIFQKQTFLKSPYCCACGLFLQTSSPSQLSTGATPCPACCPSLGPWTLPEDIITQSTIYRCYSLLCCFSLGHWTLPEDTITQSTICRCCFLPCCSNLGLWTLTEDIITQSTIYRCCSLPCCPVLAPGLFLKTSSASQLSAGAALCPAAPVLATGLITQPTIYRCGSLPGLFLKTLSRSLPFLWASSPQALAKSFSPFTDLILIRSVKSSIEPHPAISY